MFLKLFKKKKQKKQVQRYSIGSQLSQLKDIGINPNSGMTINEIIQVVDLNDIESEPYIFLMIALGGELELPDGQWVSISDDLWYFDTECIEDNGIYVQIINRLIQISRGLLQLTDIDDHVDIDKNEAWVSFLLNDRPYKWDLKVDDDWFDMSLIQKLNALLFENGFDKKYAVAVIDQSCFISFFNKEQLEKINVLSGLNFEFY